MYKGKGLSLDTIVETAEQLTVEKGFGNFSTRDIAQRLDVRAASLYNHTSGIEQVSERIGERAAIRLNTALNEAIEGKEGAEALSALAYAYRAFADENPELYRAIMGLPSMAGSPGLQEVARESFRPIRTVVDQYGLSRATGIHFARCFRSALHGFVTFQGSGYFTGRSAGAEESFRYLIRGYADWLEALSQKEHNSNTSTEKE